MIEWFELFLFWLTSKQKTDFSPGESQAVILIIARNAFSIRTTFTDDIAVFAGLCGVRIDPRLKGDRIAGGKIENTLLTWINNTEEAGSRFEFCSLIVWFEQRKFRWSGARCCA